MTDILLIMFAAILTENFIFSKFYGICPFLGVSEKPSTALGMGMAVTFVMTVSGAATYLVYTYALVPLHLEYLKTIAFILVIASLVQFIEMFLKKNVPALYGALGSISSAHHDKLRRARRGTSQYREGVRFRKKSCVRLFSGARLHSCDRDLCRSP